MKKVRKSSFLQPKQIHLLDEIPRNDSGKIAINKLRQIILSQDV